MTYFIKLSYWFEKSIFCFMVEFGVCYHSNKEKEEPSMVLHESNKSKAKNGNKYSGVLFSDLKKNMSLYNIKNLNKEKKFFYNRETADEVIASRVIDIIEKNGLSNSKATVVKLAKSETIKFLEENENNVIRTNNRFYKRADITFYLSNKYSYNGKNNQDIRVVIDTTTSARGDRIKAKAQDTSVYKTFNIPCLYFIVFPDDEYFRNAGFKNVKNEINSCQKTIYKANCCNQYVTEGITLILQEKDLKSYLKYIGTKSNEDILYLTEKWKKQYFKKLFVKREKELTLTTNELINNVTKIVTSKI